MKHVEKLIEKFPHLADSNHLNWGRIPHYMREGMIRYLLDGIPPGDFMAMVINNDLMGAIVHADQNNAKLLWDYGNFLSNYAPVGSFGYPEAVMDRVASFNRKRKELADEMDTR